MVRVPWQIYQRFISQKENTNSDTRIKKTHHSNDGYNIPNAPANSSTLSIYISNVMASAINHCIPPAIITILIALLLLPAKLSQYSFNIVTSVFIHVPFQDYILAKDAIQATRKTPTPLSTQQNVPARLPKRTPYVVIPPRFG